MSINAIGSASIPYPSPTSTDTSLTSGKKINSAADNPAALAVATGMSTDILAQTRGMRNANDGISLLQTADGAAQNMTNSMNRMYELSIQAANGTLNSSQRTMLNVEFQQQMQEMQRMAETTKFNGMSLLNSEHSSLSIALGGSDSELNLPDLSLASMGLEDLNLADRDGAGRAAEMLRSATEFMSEVRAQFGAQQNGLVSAFDNLANSQANSQQARSQIIDTNYAKAITEQTRENVLNQSAIMMQSISNQDRANTLQLLS